MTVSACGCTPWSFCGVDCLCCAVEYVIVQSESDLSAAFSALGRLEPVQKPNKAMLDWRDKAFAPGPDSEVLVEHTHSGVDVARKDIRTLRTRQWLNDEVMNVYMGLLQVRCACVLHCSTAFDLESLPAIKESIQAQPVQTPRVCLFSLACLHACIFYQCSPLATVRCIYCVSSDVTYLESVFMADTRCFLVECSPLFMLICPCHESCGTSQYMRQK